MHDKQFGLTRQQFLVTAGLGGVAVGVSACSAYGQQPAATDTAAAEPVSPGGAAAALATTADVPVGSGVIVDDVVITQPSAGTFRGFSAVCTHAGCTLADVSEGTINCRCHGSRFNLDGSVANGPAAQSLAVRPIAVNGDQIVAG